MTLNNVDLPQPEGPITPTNSPGATLSETCSTAVSTPSGVSKRLTISSTTRMGSRRAVFGAFASMRSNGTAGIYRSLPPFLVARLANSSRGPRPAYSTSSPRDPRRSAFVRRCASALLCLEWTPGAPAPILPGPIDAIGPGALGDLVHLAGGQEFDIAHVHRLLLQ